MRGLDHLGAVHDKIARPVSWPSLGFSAGAGVLGAALWRNHPVLGFLGASTLAGNAHAVLTGDRGWKSAAERMGRHVVAVVGSLAMPTHPAIGYVAGAVAADLLLDGEGGGIIEEWAHYAGIRDAPETIEIRAEGAPHGS